MSLHKLRCRTKTSSRRRATRGSDGQRGLPWTWSNSSASSALAENRSSLESLSETELYGRNVREGVWRSLHGNLVRELTSVLEFLAPFLPKRTTVASYALFVFLSVHDLALYCSLRYYYSYIVLDIFWFNFAAFLVTRNLDGHVSFCSSYILCAFSVYVVQRKYAMCE